MKLRGTGVGSMFYGIGNTGLPNPAAAFCEVLPDTSVNVTIGAASLPSNKEPRTSLFGQSAAARNCTQVNAQRMLQSTLN